jgi:hypothetical protein
MCDASKEIAAASCGDTGLTLVCDIPGVAHQWHYDETDDVAWKEGRPND